jgi:hypothetical protein
VLERMDELVRETFGEGRGLRMVEVVRGRAEDGKIP